MNPLRYARLSTAKKQERIHLKKGVPTINDLKNGVPTIRLTEEGVVQYIRSNESLYKNVFEKVH